MRMNVITVGTLITIIQLATEIRSSIVKDFKFNKICQQTILPNGAILGEFDFNGTVLDCGRLCMQTDDCHYLSTQANIDGTKTCILFRPDISCVFDATVPTSAWMIYEIIGTCTCQPGWVNYGRTCYNVWDTAMTWDDSRLFCNSKNSTLVSVTSEAENVFVSQLPIVLGYGDLVVWLGAHDGALEGVWEWLTGEPSALTFFGANEPDGGSLENLLGMWIGGGWFDELPTAMWCPVCEQVCRLI